MQEEAIKRVHEMQQRSKNLVNGVPLQENPIPEEPKTMPNQNPQTHNKRTRQQNSGSPINGLLGSILGNSAKKGGQGNGELFNIGGIKIDEEKALIALMIYILYKNGADIKLLLGLGYLLI